MAPVEGAKYLGENLVGHIDSTDPRDTQSIIDFDPSILKVSCDAPDRKGTLNVTGDLSGVIVRKRPAGGLARRLLTRRSIIAGTQLVDVTKPIVFSGPEEIIVQKKDSVFDEKIVLWHRSGEAEQPPFRRERVPLPPNPPPRSRKAEARPDEREEKQVVVAGKRY